MGAAAVILAGFSPNPAPLDIPPYRQLLYIQLQNPNSKTPTPTSMSEVEARIYQFEAPQREILLYFHKLLTTEFFLTAKITFNNPCYYQKSWICYLNPLKNGKVELAFLRGNELADEAGILKSKGRKQLRSIEISDLKSAPLDAIEAVLHEAILLDETQPYASKRKRKG